MRRISHLVAKVRGSRLTDEGVIVNGCGMDMGFALVYNLSRTLYPQYNCTGNRSWSDRCPSNTHVNKGDDRDNYSPKVVHTDGYALSQRWL